MIIAISAKGKGKSAEIDARFGRAAGFVLYDSEKAEWDYVENTQNLNAAQGAGIQSGQKVVDCGAEAVITGHCGPKAFKVLENSGVKVYLGQEGSAEDAVKLLLEGKLEDSSSPDVEGHWV